MRNELKELAKPRTIFVTGTDTEVGKTFVSALLAKSYRHSDVDVGVYKPVASGCQTRNGNLVSDDAVSLWNAAGCPKTLQDVCPQRFTAPLAPNRAAAAEGKCVDLQQLTAGIKPWLDSELLIIEGAGGLLSPIADGVLNADLIHLLSIDLPVEIILVAANRLGTIHQTLATVAAAKQTGIQISTIYLNQVNATADDSAKTNADELRRYCQIPFQQVSFCQKELPRL